MGASNDRQPLSRSTPEEQGVRSEAVLTFLEALEAAQLYLHSVMLVRHGRVIAEAWRWPYHPGCRRYVYSLSKSFTSTAVGLAAAEGRLTVDDPVVSFFPEDLPEPVSENLRAMRVKHLLTMTTGHAMDTMLVTIDPQEPNWVRAILSLPVDYPPGEHFLYDTGASYLLSAIVQKVTGQTVFDFLTPRLFEPLGISGATWETCPRGISTGGWGLSVRTEDVAKFGLFYLQKGLWNGKRILPEGWIETATAAQVRNDGPDREDEAVDWKQGYGYQFWRCRHRAYRGDGAAGQYCLVLPDQDAVVAITSETQDMQAVLDVVWETLLPALGDGPLAANPDAQERLQKRLSSLELPVAPAGPEPALTSTISGKRFELQENETGIEAVSFTGDALSTTFRAWDAAGEHRLVCGKEEWSFNRSTLPLMHPTFTGSLMNRRVDGPVQVAGRGAWVDPKTFVMTWQYLETPHHETVTCRFEGDSVEIELAPSFVDADHVYLAPREARFAGRPNPPTPLSSAGLRNASQSLKGRGAKR